MDRIESVSLFQRERPMQRLGIGLVALGALGIGLAGYLFRTKHRAWAAVALSTQTALFSGTALRCREYRRDPERAEHLARQNAAWQAELANKTFGNFFVGKDVKTLLGQLDDANRLRLRGKIRPWIEGCRGDTYVDKLEQARVALPQLDAVAAHLLIDITRDRQAEQQAHDAAVCQEVIQDLPRLLRESGKPMDALVEPRHFDLDRRNFFLLVDQFRAMEGWGMTKQAPAVIKAIAGWMLRHRDNAVSEMLPYQAWWPDALERLYWDGNLDGEMADPAAFWAEVERLSA